MESSEKYEHILNSITTSIYVVDINDYTIIAANDASGFKDKAGKAKCYELTHHRDSPCNSPEDRCPLEMVKSTKLPSTVEHIHFDTDGNKKNVQVNGYPVSDEGCSHYISKPFEQEDINNLMAEFLKIDKKIHSRLEKEVILC
ncbi:MAG: hypothetical protein V1779_06830 [bacterium]